MTVLFECLRLQPQPGKQEGYILTSGSPVFASLLSKMLALKEKCYMSSPMASCTLNNAALLPPVEHVSDNVCLQGQIVTCLLEDDEMC